MTVQNVFENKTYIQFDYNYNSYNKDNTEVSILYKQTSTVYVKLINKL